MTACIRIQYQDGITRPRLDTQLTPARGKTEHQNDVGLLREQLRQIAIDGHVSRRKDVGRVNDVG
jgi:hypothetical protein